MVKTANNERELWQNMPAFNQLKKSEFHKITFYADDQKIICRFNSLKDLKQFEELNEMHGIIEKKEISLNNCTVDKLKLIFSQKMTKKTKSIWFPYKPHKRPVKKIYKSKANLKNRYPIYIVSKGRYKNCITANALDRMGVDYYIVVEKFEYFNYLENTNGSILILPENYKKDYDTFDQLGATKSKGPGPARNFCIDHSKNNGDLKHWVLDDNFEHFYRLNNNEINEVHAVEVFRACEDFVDRFSNVPVSGMNYNSFCKSTDPVPPFLANTRIYSCLLIENDAGYRWRGRYNEDTDLSLRVLKDGLCTIQFNAFLCGKVTTQRMRGGNSKEFYDVEGTLKKSEMLQKMHPDVARVVWKFGRWHHAVDYKKFKANKLKLKSKEILSGVNDYGLKIETTGAANNG